MIRTCIASCLLLSSLVVAQSTTTSIFVPDNNTSTGGANVIPFGQSKASSTWRNQKYQTLIPASYAKKIPIRINDLAFVPTKTAQHNFDSIVIKISVTKSSSLDRTFAKNLAGRTVTVLNARNYTWNLTASQWTRIGLQKPYLWIPTLGNLVIEIEVRRAGAVSGFAGGFRTGKIERLYSFGWSTKPATKGQSGVSMAALKVELVSTDADARPFGNGCAGSKGTPVLSYSGRPQIGKSFTVHLTNVLSSSVALHVVGANSSAPIFPLNLTSLGAPGCLLFVSPDMAFTVPTGTGSAKVLLPLPNNSALVGVRYWEQFFVLDKKANKFGFVASNHGRVLIGK